MADSPGPGVTIIARCVHGIEWICAEEIDAAVPAATDVTLRRREVTFTVPEVAAPLCGLRTVDDVFVLVGQVDGVGDGRDVPAELARRVASLDLASNLAGLDRAAPRSGITRFDVVASLEGRRTFNRYAVENAVGAALAPLLRASYLERTGTGRSGGEPDLTVRIFIRGTAARVAFRLGLRPLHRRWYKQDTGPATLHPPLAAAMSRLIRATPATGRPVILDPFCGDATIAIEAALSYPEALVVAGDIDPSRLDNARRNAHRAAVSPAIVRADAANPPWRAGSMEAVVTNPPWHIAVEAMGRLSGRLDPMWAWLPAVLGERGRICVITDAATNAPGALRSRGYRVALASRIRLAGRISHLLLGAPPGRPAFALPPSLAGWRRRAIADGVVTEVGF